MARDENQRIVGITVRDSVAYLDGEPEPAVAGSAVRFVTADGRHFIVEPDPGGGIVIHGSMGVAVLPAVSNAIVIRLRA